MTDQTRATFVALTLLVAILAGTAYVLRDELTALSPAVTRIYIEGELRHLSDAQVVAIVQPLLGARFLGLDVAEIHRQLTVLPWVRGATVRKRWPNGVVLYLREREPAARWGSTALVDADGTVFTPAELDALVLNLPTLDGPDLAAAPRLLTQYRTWAARVQRASGAPVVRLAEDARGALRLSLSLPQGTGIELVLGRKEAEARLQRFTRSVVPALGARLANAQRVDLRYRDGFAVAWRAPAPASTPNPVQPVNTLEGEHG